MELEVRTNNFYFSFFEITGFHMRSATRNIASVQTRHIISSEKYNYPLGGYLLINPSKQNTVFL